MLSKYIFLVRRVAVFLEKNHIFIFRLFVSERHIFLYIMQKKNTFQLNVF